MTADAWGLTSTRAAQPARAMATRNNFMAESSLSLKLPDGMTGLSCIKGETGASEIARARSQELSWGDIPAQYRRPRSTCQRLFSRRGSQVEGLGLMTSNAFVEVLVAEQSLAVELALIVVTGHTRLRVAAAKMFQRSRRSHLLALRRVGAQLV